jgi:hypothetical protein
VAESNSVAGVAGVAGLWTCLQRRVGGYSPFPVYLVLECMTDDAGIARLRGVRLRTTTIFFRGEETFFYAKSAAEFDSTSRDEVETQKKMIAALDDDPAYPQDSLKRFQARSKPFLKFCASFDSAESFSTAEIIAAHERYSREYRNLSFDGEPVAFMLQQPLAGKIEALVKTKLSKTKTKAKESINDVMALLSTPDAPSFVKREEFDLLAASASVAEGKKKIDEIAAAHWGEYEWLEYDYEGALLSIEHFQRLMTEAIRAADGNPRARLDALRAADAAAQKRRAEGGRSRLAEKKPFRPRARGARSRVLLGSFRLRARGLGRAALCGRAARTRAPKIRRRKALARTRGLLRAP